MNIYTNQETKSETDGYYWIKDSKDQDYFYAIAEKYRLVINNKELEPPYLVGIKSKNRIAKQTKGEATKGLTVGEISIKEDSIQASLSNLEDDILVKLFHNTVRKSAQVEFKAYGMNGVATCKAFFSKDGRVFEIISGKGHYLNVELRNEHYFKRSVKKDLDHQKIKYIEY